MKPQQGFSLIELAIALMILGLITLGAVVSMTQQAEQRRFAQARSQLETVREAALAFVIVNGRLPCPATATSNGQESIASNASGIITCSLEAGFVPAVTLGLTGLDSQGLINNPWDDGANGAGTRPRALRYALTSLSSTVANALSSPGLGAPASTTRRADVQASMTAGQGWFICASAAGIGWRGERMEPGRMKVRKQLHAGERAPRLPGPSRGQESGVSASRRFRRTVIAFSPWDRAIRSRRPSAPA